MKISVDYSEVYQASVYVKNKADSYNDLIQNLYKKWSRCKVSGKVWII